MQIASRLKTWSSASVEVEIESAIDADVFNEDSNYDEKFWNVLSKKKDQTTGRLVAETIENNFGTSAIYDGNADGKRFGS